MSAEIKKTEAKATGHPESSHHPEVAEVAAPQVKKRISFNLSTVVAFFVLLVAFHGALFAWIETHNGAPQAEAEPATELPLGKYHFATSSAGNALVRSADFSIYVTLLRTDEKKARSVLKTHERRVRQEIEQILRQSHGGDFSDPSLIGLKDTIRSQLNELFGFKAIGAVVITDMTMEGMRPHSLSGAEAEEMVGDYGDLDKTPKSSKSEKNSSGSH